MFTFYLISSMTSLILLFWIILIPSIVVIVVQLLSNDFDMEDVNKTVLKVCSVLVASSIFFLITIPSYDMRLSMMLISLPENEIVMREIIVDKIKFRKEYDDIQRQKERFKLEKELREKENEYKD